LCLYREECYILYKQSTNGLEIAILLVQSININQLINIKKKLKKIFIYYNTEAEPLFPPKK